MSETMTYEGATARLEDIIKRLDSGEAGLRETLDLSQEGRGLVVQRKVGAARGPEIEARRARLDSLAAAIGAHDPERVIARGYAVVDDREGNLITSAEAARDAGAVRLFFADADVDARIEE
jgi:exonuclease VII large subunit